MFVGAIAASGTPLEIPVLGVLLCCCFVLCVGPGGPEGLAQYSCSSPGGRLLFLIVISIARLLGGTECFLVLLLQWQY